MKKFARITAFLSCAGLLLLCAKQSIAGIWFEFGRQAYQQQQYSEAGSYLEKALVWDSRDPRILYLAGQSGWKQIEKQQQDETLKKTRQYFEKLTTETPFYGRAWLYLAFIKLAEEKNQRSISPEFWNKEIQPLFKKAAHYEPGSAWVSFKIASITLEEAPALGPTEEKRCLKQLQQASKINPKNYLRPSLGVLWNRFRDFRLLKSLVSENYSDYQILLKVIAEKNLWTYAEPVFQRYLELQRAEYEALCKRGEAVLAARDYKKAIRYFQQAHGIQQKWPRAKEGMISAYEASGELPEKFRQWPEEIRAAKEVKEIDAPTLSLGAAEWRKRKGNSVIGPKEKNGTVLKLHPGKKEVLVSVRSFPDTQGVYGFVLFRAADQIVGFSYTGSSAWKKVPVRFETAGGPIWFEAELLNLPVKEGFRKAVVELGDLEVRDV